MVNRLRQSKQLLWLTQAFEEKERWTLAALEADRLRETQALERHRQERQHAQRTFAQQRMRGLGKTSDLARQADFLRWSRDRDNWHRPLIDAAREKVAAQQEVVLAMMNRRKTVEKMVSELDRLERDRRRKQEDRELDEWVIQRWKPAGEGESE